ncbi:MAG: MotA/TolQ/ExbB proton channel family protein, partial [Terrimicrobiaceae bacterium]
VVASGGNITLFVNGKEYGSVSALIPAMNTPYYLGGDAAGSGSANGRFVGEIDEMHIARVATPAGGIAFTALNQSGAEAAGKLLVPGEDEGGHAAASHGGALEHVMLFGDIANNMMFDGWIAVVVCVIMMFAGWTVAVKKYIDLGKTEKGNAEFQKLWKDVASDLTSMDLDDPEANKSFGGKIGKKGLQLLKDSPLYHVYHVGSEEIRHRLGRGKNKGQGLSARSIQAIRAALDAALVHEQHRLNKNIVYLTVSIAGGPYVGLLGTVVGVMITFAIIAKSGEVDVNSIAPGIASALLATTVGLLVAIPALFAYSFLNTRIKGVIGTMQVFIDEFVAKIAEFYPPPGEGALSVPIRQIRKPEEAIRQLEKEAVDEEIRDEVRK